MFIVKSKEMEQSKVLKSFDQKQRTRQNQKNTTHHKNKKDSSSEDDNELEDQIQEFRVKNSTVQHPNQKIKTGSNGRRETIETALKKQKRKDQSQKDSLACQLKKEIAECEE